MESRQIVSIRFLFLNHCNVLVHTTKLVQVVASATGLFPCNRHQESDTISHFE